MDQGSDESLNSWDLRYLTRLLVGMLLLAGIATGVVGWLYFQEFGGGLSDNRTDWSQFGDFIGGTLNPIFALFALVALLITLRVQSAELRLSSKELKNSADALRDQNKSLTKQNFESTFFELIRLHNDIVRGMDVRDSNNSNVIQSGRDCFKYFYKALRGRMLYYTYADAGTDKYVSDLTVEYKDFYEHFESDLGHYFRHLHRIYKFLADSSVEDKKGYSGILRAQLSSYELALLFYNGVSPLGAKFRQHIEFFALFENLRTDLLISWKNDKQFLNPSAFGDQAAALFPEQTD